MTFNIHTTQKTIVTAMLSVLIFAPFVSFAQTDRERVGNARFCTNLDSIERALFSKLDKRTDTARDTHGSQVDTYTELKSERITQLHDKRNTADDNWKNRIEELQDRATDAQGDAIDVFVSTMEELVKERREAVDVAIDTFEADVQDLRDERTEVFSDSIERYKSAIHDAFDDARDACDAGDNPVEVRTQLRADITALQKAFKEERQGYSFRADFNELREVRKEAVAKARVTFKEGFAEAKEILRKVFGA